jgi:hypothetical protein
MDLRLRLEGAGWNRPIERIVYEKQTGQKERCDHQKQDIASGHGRSPALPVVNVVAGGAPHPRLFSCWITGTQLPCLRPVRPRERLLSSIALLLSRKNTMDRQKVPGTSLSWNPMTANDNQAVDYFGIEDVISPDTPSFVAGVP